MVKLNSNFAEQQTQNQQAFNQQNQSQFNSAQAQSNQTFNSQQANQQAQPLNQPKGLLTLPPAVLQMVPWIPLMLEMTTGQKIPQMSGTIGEIQTSIQQLQTSLAQVINNQNQIWTKLESLESNTNNSFKILATETKRSLELINSFPKPELNH